MPRRKKLPAGEHRAFLKSRKKSESVVLHTPTCRCGWSGDESSARTSALEQFDRHVEEMKRG